MIAAHPSAKCLFVVAHLQATAHIQIGQTAATIAAAKTMRARPFRTRQANSSHSAAPPGRTRPATRKSGRVHRTSAVKFIATAGASIASTTAAQPVGRRIDQSLSDHIVAVPSRRK